MIFQFFLFQGISFFLFPFFPITVIALACGYNERELCYTGMVGIMDPPRPGVAESIEIVQSAGVKVKMVTGDALETACSIGIVKNFRNIA